MLGKTEVDAEVDADGATDAHGCRVKYKVFIYTTSVSITPLSIVIM